MSVTPHSSRRRRVDCPISERFTNDHFFCHPLPTMLPKAKFISPVVIIALGEATESM